MTIIVLQCRLSSTRLEKKALLPLGNKELLRWTLKALKKVCVDQYWLACDEDSYPILSKIAREENWKCTFGPKDDVLERFCLVAQNTGCKTILRATADNPFLFYEAAQQSLEEFSKRKCDYFSYLGLPHGSGVEVFSATALLRARDLTNSSYDHEHVGPSLYNYPDKFSVVFEKAPVMWTHEEDNIQYRTTVDTLLDYKRTLRIFSYLQSSYNNEPYTAEQIFSALRSIYVQKPILFIPAVNEGRGTGHIRRIIDLVIDYNKTKALYADIFIPQNISTATNAIIQQALDSNALHKHNIIKELPKEAEYAFCITDAFVLDTNTAKKLHNCFPVIAIDEGSKKTEYFEYLLDIIPPLSAKKGTNSFMPELLNLEKIKYKASNSIKKILISIGGEDPKNFSQVLYDSLNEIFLNDDVDIVSTANTPIMDLRKHIHEFDVVITHYGLTAFEAINAGCALLTVETSQIHKKLSKKYGIVCLSKKECTPKKLKLLLENRHILMKSKLNTLLHTNTVGTLNNTVINLAQSTYNNCPICGKTDIPGKIIARNSEKTIRRCIGCKMLYISFCIEKNKEYTENYFFNEYKTQYGKTYLEDFDSIKEQGLRRIKNIRTIQATKNKASALDIGCAYGPFLAALKDEGYEPYGTDISKDAVNYVESTLKINAKKANFSSSFNARTVFGKDAPANNKFDIITMWYVIEHFRDLNDVLHTVSKLLENGGVFAFSTPNAAGISKRTNKKKFFKQSPVDHYSLWESTNVKKILLRYGFKVKKIKTTGIHKKRFPFLLRVMPDIILNLLAKICYLGDTFEVYCIKKREI